MKSQTLTSQDLMLSVKWLRQDIFKVISLSFCSLSHMNFFMLCRRRLRIWTQNLPSFSSIQTLLIKKSNRNLRVTTRKPQQLISSSQQHQSLPLVWMLGSPLMHCTTSFRASFQATSITQWSKSDFCYQLQRLISRLISWRSTKNELKRLFSPLGSESRK